METIKVHLKETPHAWWARVADGDESHHYSAEHPLDALCMALGLPVFGEYIPALDSESLNGVTLTLKKYSSGSFGLEGTVTGGCTAQGVAHMLAEMIVQHEMGYDVDGAEWDEGDEECDCDPRYPESCAHAGGNAADVQGEIIPSAEIDRWYERCGPLVFRPMLVITPWKDPSGLTLQIGDSSEPPFTHYRSWHGVDRNNLTPQAGIRIAKGIEVYGRCPDCKGTRVYEGLFSREPCRTCKGAGVV